MDMAQGIEQPIYVNDNNLNCYVKDNANVMKQQHVHFNVKPSLNTIRDSIVG